MIDKIIETLERYGTTVSFLSEKTGIEYNRIYSILYRKKTKLSADEKERLKKFTEIFQ